MKQVNPAKAGTGRLSQVGQEWQSRARLHLVFREGVAIGEVLVVVHVLRVGHKGLQRDAGVAIAIQDLAIELCGTIAVPARSHCAVSPSVVAVRFDRAVRSDGAALSWPA